jgi:Fe-S-cluster containining protein
VIHLTDDWNLRAEAICHTCGGHCCDGACPPLSTDRIRIILAHGSHNDKIEQNGYHRIRTKENGECAMMENGRCIIHAIKPETCRAGPFTFSVTGTVIEIFLKHESICPLVTHLKADPEMYAKQYARAAENIVELVAALPEEELLVISAIPEPDTDKIAELPRQPVLRCAPGYRPGSDR